VRSKLYFVAAKLCAYDRQYAEGTIQIELCEAALEELKRVAARKQARGGDRPDIFQKNHDLDR
jgi:hypothetical protein